MTVEQFWKPWETRVESFEDLMQLIGNVFKRWTVRGRTFAWRGQSNAAWALHSSLYRELLAESPANPPDEEALYSREGDALGQSHKWGLHFLGPVRLSMMSQMALLQHYGAPTRFIDVTFNPLIAAWFAVCGAYDGGEPSEPTEDSRIFAVDVTDRLLDRDKKLRVWPDDKHRPWPHQASSHDANRRGPTYTEWQQEVYAWRPTALDPRMAAQAGGFLLGGVPTSSTQVPKEPAARSSTWRVAEVREATSLALRIHKSDPGRGGVSSGAVYTARIAAGAKDEIRKQLEDCFGYRHALLFPDYPGFVKHGRAGATTRP